MKSYKQQIKEMVKEQESLLTRKMNHWREATAGTNATATPCSQQPTLPYTGGTTSTRRQTRC